MAYYFYGDFKDLSEKTTSDKVLRYKTFNIVKNPKCDGYMRECTSTVYKLFDEKSTVGHAFFSKKKSICRPNKIEVGKVSNFTTD